MKRRAAIGVALSAFLGIASAEGRAGAAPSARLVYLRDAGAEACPDERAIRAAVITRLGYDPFDASAPTTLFAELSKTDDGTIARVKVVEADNTVRASHEVSGGRDCGGMLETLSLSMSVALDPDSADRADASEPAPDAPPLRRPEVVRPPEPPPPERPEPAGEAPDRSSFRLEAGFGPAVWIGAAPAVDVAGMLFLRGRGRGLSLAFEGRLDLPASRSVGAATVRSSQTLASLVPCLHFGWFGACVVGAIGQIRLESSGVRAPRSEGSVHVAVGPRAEASFAVAEDLAIEPYVSGLLTLTPQRLALDGGDVYELPRLSGGAGTNVVWRF